MKSRAVRPSPRVSVYSASAALLALFSLSNQSSQAASGWNWYAMPLVTSASLANGVYPGGEGCQRPQAVAVDPVDAQIVLYGTDVGGVFRSTDGGANFTPSNVGLDATGVLGIAFDPMNRDRVLLIGDGGNNFNQFAGVYLSTNAGATWTRRYDRVMNAVAVNNRQNGRDQIAFFKGSFDAGFGHCRTVYWVSEDDITPTTFGGSTVANPGGALYKSADGGTTWARVAVAALYEGANDADSRIAVHPTSGFVYIANKNGFFRSIDGGVSFSKILAGNFKACEVVATSGFENHVWIASATQLLRSIDSGASFSPIAFSGITGFARLKVSAANPQRMLASNGSFSRFRSQDGGTTWTASAESSANSWVLTNNFADADRRCHAAFHPTNANIVFGLGKGDQLMKSTDGGASFSWSSNGINGLMIGSSFNFNATDPDLVYIGAQDYNGAYTENGGASWTFLNLDGSDSWGWVYGAYGTEITTEAGTQRIFFGGNYPWNVATNSVSTTPSLVITRDGGASRSTKVTPLTGLRVSYGDPTDANVLFCWSQRSADGGVTWAQMADCDGVFIHHRVTNALYGAKGAAVKRSTSKGVSWSTVTTLPASVSDVAPHPVLDRLWVVAGGRLYRCDGPAYTPVEVLAGSVIRSVAIDPLKPETIYVAGTNGTFRKNTDAVRRSTDGGASWHRLTNHATLTDGGNCPEWVRVHPVTGEALFGTNCYGLWSFAPPVPVTGTLLGAEADAHVQGGVNAAANFGSSAALLVKNDTGADFDRQTFLRFNLAGVPASLEHARLRVFVREIGVGTATYELLQVANDTWAEGSVNWNTRPAVGTVIDTTTIAIGGELVFDVTAYVAAQAAGDGKASFALRRAGAESTAMIYLGSKEAPISAERPALEYASGVITLPAVAADAEARRVGTGDGGGTVSNAGAAELFVGNANDAGSACSPVYVFQLPSLGAVANPFSAATFSVGLSTSTTTFSGHNVDVYGLAGRAAATVLAGDAFAGANDTTGATKLQDNWVNLNVSPAAPVGVRTLSNTALVAYLNAEYAAGAGAGRFVFLRLSPDTAGNTWKNVRFAASEYVANAAWKPTLVLSR